MSNKFIKYLQNSFSGAISLVNLLIIFSLLFFFVSCDAPRSNPADPMNDDNSDNVTIEGIVQTLSLPYTPLTKVLVMWIPEKETGMVRETDSKGYFVISNIDPVNGILVFQKEGYMPDTLKVTWNGNNKIINQTINLNEIPRADSLILSTSVMNIEPGVWSSELIISTKINDKDNDVDSVYVLVPQSGAGKWLEFNVTSKKYEAVFTPEELNIDNMEKAVGFDFNLYVKDIFNKTIFVGTERISRVITDNVKLVSPSGDVQTGTSPAFRWEKYSAGFEFTYSLEVYTNDFARQLVANAERISSDSLTYKLQAPLEPDNYYWIIWVVDKYNNKSMSLPATFVVK